MSASARQRRDRPGVDEALSVHLVYPSGVGGRASCDMDAPGVWDYHVTLTGTDGVLHVPDFPRPHEDDTLVQRRPDGRESVEHLGRRSSYTYQLEAFAAHVRLGSPLPVDAQDSVQQARLLDSAYRAAGLDRREGQPLD